jgi:hypothetical protein
MAKALEDVRPGEAAHEVLVGRARADGAALSAQYPGDLLTLLKETGYEPLVQPDGTVQMRNCPFNASVEVAPRTTCAMNLALLGAMTAKQPPPSYDAVFAPAQGRCCVLLRPG